MLKIKLYPCFQHLLKFNNIWLYSDPHFADPEMPHIRKNYIGDEEQVARINKKVGRNDCLIILGDIGDASWVSKIRGYKILVMGNHDLGASNYKRRQKIVYHSSASATEIIKGLQEKDEKLIYKLYDELTTPHTVDNHLFDEVYEGPVCLAEKIILSHEPLDLNCMLNIHGHTHALSSKPKDSTHLCVCAEHIDYTPVSLVSIIKDGGLSKIESIHRQTIDTATKRKQKRKWD